MKILKVGTKVRISRTVSFGYDEQNERIIHYQSVSEDNYYLIGIRHQPLGKYHTGEWFNSIEGAEYDPPYLIVKETVKVALVVKSLKNKPVTVLYSDIEDQLI